MNWLKAINELKLPPLVSGHHAGGPEHGLCAMEMVAFMERLEHTDKPECTCPVITGFVISINDTLSDEERQKLLPVLPELVDTVVESHVMREREHFIMNAAARSLEYANRRHHEYDYERDRMRGFPRGSRMSEQAQYMLSKGTGGAVKCLAVISPPFQLADILIGILRDALKIGATQPQTEFKDSERVKELAEVTYLPPDKLTAQKVNLKVLYNMPTIKHSKVFSSFDCMV